MPQKIIPKCMQCEKLDSPMWRTTEIGQICHDCFEQNATNLKTELEPENENSNNGNGGAEEKKVRKSTRATRLKTKVASTTTTVAGKTIPKGKSRRCIFKKTPNKTPSVPASTHTAESVFYKGSYIQVGDIVSLMDDEDNVYYAQIRGLLVDTFCDKSAYLTWLIPTQSSPPPNELFDPSTYLIGPDEDVARNLSCMEFIMHAPSNYYHDKTNPFPAPDTMDFNSPSAGFIWTTLKPHERNKSE